MLSQPIHRGTLRNRYPRPAPKLHRQRYHSKRKATQIQPTRNRTAASRQPSRGLIFYVRKAKTMLHLYDRATMARALTLDLDAQLRTLLAARIAALVTAEHDLTNDTEYLIVEPGDTEADIIRHLGFTPLVEPIEGARFDSAGFHPPWDWLADHAGWYEMIVTFGSTFAYVLFIRDADGVDPELLALCRHYTGGRQ